MADRRIVKCFGTKRVPGKEDKPCRRQFMWTASGISGNFGGGGIQACPYCGTLPDLQHPVNRGLHGDFQTQEQVNEAWVDYEEKLKKRK